MLIKILIDNDLGHVSYLIADEDTQKAMIVDPRRDIKYIHENNLELDEKVNKI